MDYLLKTKQDFIEEVNFYGYGDINEDQFL